MARPLFQNIFLRLPPATAVLLLSAVFALTDGHALPRQTKVVAYHELDVIPFPPVPTGQALSPFELWRRQDNTICGYIGGNLDLPATCSSGSHCVLDAVNSVVGCCPNGGACTTGVFTGCVDRNSDPQTEINPYVYTCQGTNVCYMNNFAGGYFQYGCGTASTLGTTVHMSADGATTALSITTVGVSLTATPSSLSEPTTIGSFASTETRSSTTSSKSSTKSTTSSKTSSHSTSSTSPSSSTSSTDNPSPTNLSPAPSDTGSAERNQTGAIIGGVVGGAAAAIALVALVFFCLRRRNRNRRVGPGPAPGNAPPTTQYISPMQSHGAAFAPLPTWHEEDESAPSNLYNHSHPQPPEPYGPLESTRADRQPVSYGPVPTLSTPAPVNLGVAAAAPHSYPQPRRYNPGYNVGYLPQPKGSLTPVAEEEQSLDREFEASQGREIDDFSRAYSNAGIGQLTDTDEDVEEGGDRTPLRGNSNNNNFSNSNNTASTSAQPQQEDDSANRKSVGHRPLWQQNRQQSRNLMWL